MPTIKAKEAVINTWLGRNQMFYLTLHYTKETIDNITSNDGQSNKPTIKMKQKDISKHTVVH